VLCHRSISLSSGGPGKFARSVLNLTLAWTVRAGRNTAERVHRWDHAYVLDHIELRLMLFVPVLHSFRANQEPAVALPPCGEPPGREPAPLVSLQTAEHAPPVHACPGGPLALSSAQTTGLPSALTRGRSCGCHTCKSVLGPTYCMETCGENCYGHHDDHLGTLPLHWL
jgi:hypothetical protein